ncbi:MULTISPECIES: hydroxyacylglutathione hydrolase [unclassified Halomonas]|uniref:hydroxyacylglutathione hydrolase n=1 Tax=unclassified Halomonas TaxID=2609666 RepID=UPI0006D9FBAF|nr:MULTISPECIES: hydroxyacylglutathione hydrolase [unclassified Halomonas]KPQ21127.1 MAG: hydroxyacylglutathione hydrolase GloB [Halomonas sp. HL-93]SBR48677.1 hydroxyacylglutathione hydrolase [Halomonas sp. HL-93]SNY96162.1 hydroxyacylglutathione hydrolase [Halomonas sp. hl-4]
MMSVTPIPALSDNYIWLLRQDTSQEVCVVDPGEALPVIEFLERESLSLSTVLITHHHPDHTDGLGELIKRYAPRVIGPKNPSINGVEERVGDGDEVRVMGRLFEVFETPGHTLDHISYFTPGIPPLLFCGDTLFCAGCGRLFEGTPEQMHAALKRLAALPEETFVFAAHEYTQANLRFASEADPENEDVKHALMECDKARALDRPTLPSTIGRELKINPYLRVGTESVRNAASKQGSIDNDLATFATLREWKNRY